jgi:hypothetical protein
MLLSNRRHPTGRFSVNLRLNTHKTDTSSLVHVNSSTNRCYAISYVTVPPTNSTRSVLFIYNISLNFYLVISIRNFTVHYTQQPYSFFRIAFSPHLLGKHVKISFRPSIIWLVNGRRVSTMLAVLHEYVNCSDLYKLSSFKLKTNSTKRYTEKSLEKCPHST